MKVAILIDSESDVVTVKCEDFLMDIFSYYDNSGEKLLTMKRNVSHLSNRRSPTISVATFIK